MQSKGDDRRNQLGYLDRLMVSSPFSDRVQLEGMSGRDRAIATVFHQQSDRGKSAKDS